MELINLEQGSKAWHAFRAEHKMASETPALLGLNPWTPRTPLQLFDVKSGYAEIFEHDAMRHGKDWESAGRAYMEGVRGCKYPACVVLGDDDYAASLDGYNADDNTVLEIKCPLNGAESVLWTATQAEGGPPEHYYFQVQHQIMVTGAGGAYFAVYDASEDVALYTWVERDDDAITRLRAAWDEFWPFYRRNEPPPAQDGDVRRMTGADWAKAAEQWKDAKKALQAAQNHEKLCREVLSQLAGDRSAQGAGVRLTQFFRKGNVQYKNIPELKGVDLDQYRAMGTYVIKLSEEKS